MSNQSVNGFQSSQPFITDKQFQNLSLDEIRHIITQEKEELKKDYKELASRRKLINQYKKLVEARQKVKSGIDIKKNLKKKLKKNKKVNNIPKRIKTFDEYFKECIKNKEIPKDTPEYFREALEQAKREYDQGLVKEKSSLKGFANKYVIEGISGINHIQFFRHIDQTLIEFLNNHKNIKFRLVLVCILEKQIYDKNGISSIETTKAYFNSETLKNLRFDEPEKLLETCFNTIDARIASYTKDGSEWYVKEIVQLEIHTTEHNPTKGSSYIDLPKWIKDKKAIINIKNKDDKCFLWCILRYLHPKEKDAEWIGDLKKYENSLNTKGITFPISKNDINKFENLNPNLPGINIFYLDEKDCIVPGREIMKGKDCKNTIDLFLIEKDGKSHYTLIKNFHRLVRSQKTGTNKKKLFICKRCFWHFSKEELLDKHIEYCLNNKTAVVDMPPKNKFIHFKNYYKQLPIPFVVYADFECFTKPMNSCSPNPKDS